MTDDEAKAFGLRALKAGFRWAAGVLAMYDGSDPKEHRLCFWYDHEGEWCPVMSAGGHQMTPSWGWPAKGSGWWPDFRDPATLGVLLAQVREAWESGSLVYRPWTLWAYFDTEAEALVAALEAAP